MKGDGAKMVPIRTLWKPEKITGEKNVAGEGGSRR